MKDFGAALRDADVLIVVPPFAALQYPSLAAHLLQACGHEAGFQVHVLYANLLLASCIGEEEYSSICYAPTGAFAGERFFARCAFGLPALGHNAEKLVPFPVDRAANLDPDFVEWEEPINLSQLRQLEEQTVGWVDQIAETVSKRAYRIVGCTTTFEQTAASVALLRRIKRLREDIITIIGGANCEGEMAQGVASVSTSIDYVFSGESEETFPAFAQAILAGLLPKDRLIYSEPCRRLDELPTPVFSEYYEQRAQFLPDSKTALTETEIPYETSRGCWWGQKQHCTFCGLNGEGMAFRYKSPDRVMDDLSMLSSGYPSRNITMTDNIMPHDYFRTLLPRLERELPRLSIFYEQKANLSLHNVLALKNAGIVAIQPGIEALSSRLLRRMKKGVQARQNLMLLRYARAAGLHLSWNLLWGFPGDEREAYEETATIVPLLHHLQPPSAFGRLGLDRFSPYFLQPSAFGVTNIRPLPAYYDFLPETADIPRIAYHFMGSYQCGADTNIEVIRQLGLAVKQWHTLWQPDGGKPPELRVDCYRGRYVLVDTRGLHGAEQVHLLDRNEVTSLLIARPYTGSEQEVWALQQKLAVIADDWFIPLAVAAPDILLEFETEQKTQRPAVTNSPE